MLYSFITMDDHNPLLSPIVLIRPEEQKLRKEAEVKQQSETNLTKKSVTNVSHTHHTHYNFKDEANDEG